MSHHTVEPSSPATARKVMLASFIGTTIEWYDFFLYGTAAALVFNSLFFPNYSELSGTVAAFGAFAAGFLARPLGGIVFGHFGDRVGRKSMLVSTLLIMGATTVLIGLLPTYASAGVLAPVLLVALRVVQGFAVGGEWGGAMLMSVEHSPRKSRGFAGSWVQAGSPAGLVLATGAFAACAALPEDQFMSWGWRVPFLLSALLLVVGLFIRLRVLESPEFTAVQQADAQARLPLLDALRTHPRNLVMAVGACLAPFVTFYMFAVFVLTYATRTLGIAQGDALLVVAVASAIEVVTIPAAAALSDRIGRRTTFISGTVALAVFAYPFFAVNDASNGSVLVFGLSTVLGLSIIHPFMYGPLAALFADMFETRHRYSAASLGYQVGGMLGGGFAPLILTALLATMDGAPWLIPPYIIFTAILTSLAVLFAVQQRPSDPVRGSGPVVSAAVRPG